MTNVFCPMIELGAIIPGIVLAYFPIKKHLKVSKLRLFPVMILSLVCLCTLCGFVCYRYNLKSFVLAIPIVLALSAAYCCSLKTSMWKSVSVLLAVCGVFACIASITRAVDSITFPQNTTPWFEIKSAVLFNILCWMFVILAWYPATHGVSELLDDENIAQTWYVFWVLPVLIIGLNLVLIPKYNTILHTQRFLRGYIVIVYALLLILALFYTMFLMMANILNKNQKLQQENLFLSVQQERYENLRSAIEEARQARHDIRHHFVQLSVMADDGNLEKIKDYLQNAMDKIPSFDFHFCENQSVDNVIGYYYALAQKEEIPFDARVDLPQELSVNEMDLCLILSNLLENALEASRKTTMSRQQILLEIRQHSASLLLIRVENNFDGIIKEKSHLLHSTKRKGLGIGTQSVRRMAEKNDGSCNFTYENGVFTAKIMLRATL